MSFSEAKDLLSCHMLRGSASTVLTSDMLLKNLNVTKQAVRLGGRHNMPQPLLTVGQRVCKFKGVSEEILRVF